MNEENLLARVARGEDNLTEFKPETVNDAQIRRTLTGFANTVSGDDYAVLFIGVADNGMPMGLTATDAKQKKVSAVAQGDCYPPIAFSSQVIHKDGKQILAVIVTESDGRPHFAGPAFVRIGSQSVNASEQMYEELIASRHTKAGTILKRKGDVITVIARKKLGSTKLLRDPRYRARRECRIESCDPHTVHLFDLATGQHAHEPLEKVTLGWDGERGRFQLLVDE